VRLAEVAGDAFAHDAANRFLNREDELSRIGKERGYAQCHTDRTIQWHRKFPRNLCSSIIDKGDK